MSTFVCPRCKSKFKYFYNAVSCLRNHPEYAGYKTAELDKLIYEEGEGKL